MHEPRYTGIRFVTVTCSCGWVHQNCKSRGEARRSFEGHMSLRTVRLPQVFGVDARRRSA